MEYITPSQLIKEDVSVTCDLATALSNYEANPKRFGTEGELRVGKKSNRVTISGETVTDGIVALGWSLNGKTGVYYSVVVELSDEDVDAIEALLNKLREFLGEMPGFEEWSVVSPLRGEKLTVKLKSVDKQFDAKFNGKKVQTKNHGNIGLEQDQKISFMGKFEPFFKFAEQRAELNFIVSRVFFDPINIEENEAPSKPKRKRED